GGTYTPPGHWNQIAEQIALQQGNSLSANARLFAELNVALADAGITAWNTKYVDSFWRPVTAIQQADLDGNALTVADSTWSSFLITPPFPEYISGHSTFSGAAAEILTSVFGPSLAFTTTSLGLPGVQRSFTSFEQATQEAGRSRIYGGIHFEFSNQDGLTAGQQLAQFVLNRFTVTSDTQGPTILLNQQNNAVTNTNLTLTGQVLDNLSGVAALQAKLDIGAFTPVTLSATGTFSLPTTLALDGANDGAHTVTFQATDNQNNVSTVLFSFTLDTQAPTFTLTSPLDNAALTVGTRLSGTAEATGSRLVELCYKFDNGTLVPVSFDSTTGSFDTPLDLSRLAVGVHTLSLRAQDAAGNATTITHNVTLAAPIPLTITTVTPQQGLSNVGTTFRPQVFFSRPINPGSLTSTNFYATDSAGTRLTATIVPSQDGTFAWLFFSNPMPGGETITVHVAGDTILAAGDGQALDADGNGTPGGTFTSTFSTVSLVPLQGTTLSGKVLDPGPDLRVMTFDDIRVGPDGVLHTSDDLYLNPLAGVKVYIVGLESQAVFTDAQGNFSFSAVPSGDIKLAIDGRTATNAPVGFYFPEMVMDLQIEVGQANTVMGTMGTREAKAANLTRPEVYLPRLQTSILQAVNDTATTMITVDAEAAPNLTAQQRQFLTLEIQPGSLIGPDGQPLINGQVGISTVPPELVRDMLPPGLLQHTFDITIQAPDAAAFNTPLQMT
ncbi:MAG: Ig-like domain-containing protein, partial [Vicinamibacterales bacterium]